MDDLTKPATLANTFCNSGDKTGTIPTADTGTNAASLAKGFPLITSTPVNEGGVPPKRKDFNGIINLLSQYCFHLQNGGTFEYSAEVATAIGGYSNKAVLRYIDPDNGCIRKIKSLINNNQNAPSNTNIRVSSSETGTFYWQLIDDIMPATMLPFAGGVVPEGWLLIDGSEVSIATYSFLNRIIGGLYGTPEDNTKFKLPDFRNRTFWGGDTTNVGTVKDSALPNIKGSITGTDSNWRGVVIYTPTASGAFAANVLRQGVVHSADPNNNSRSCEINIDASRSSAVYKNGQTIVQPPAIQTPFIIKY